MSFGYRTPEETAALKAEAERRVRAGWSRADVGRELCVPSSTLAIWAAAGGWRLKDLRAETAEDDAAEAQARIDAIPSFEPESPPLAGERLSAISDAPAQSPHAAAIAALEAATRWRAAGRLDKAEAEAKLAERLLRAAVRLAALPTLDAGGAAVDPHRPEGGYKEELKRRLLRIVEANERRDSAAAPNLRGRG